MPEPDLVVISAGPPRLLPPTEASIVSRIFAFLKRLIGITMTAPTVTAEFTSASYAPGQTMEIEVSATGANTTPVPFTVPVTVADNSVSPPVETTVDATTAIETPNALTASEGDTSGRTWTPGTPAQTGQSFTTTFSTTA